MMEVVRGGCHMQSGILGVGMNILSAPEIHNSGYLGACLQDFSAHDLDFKRVMINTIQTIISSVDAFENIEIADICGMWNDFDCFYNSNVSIVAQNSRIKGVSRGIGKNGELLVIQSDGTVAKIQQGNAKIVLDSQV
jgi:biotin-(acetyl-CoA carboxylase) ligase